MNSQNGNRQSIYPMRVVLRMTRGARAGHHQAAMISQLLKSAAGIANGKGADIPLDHGFPQGVIPDAVEVGRMQLEQNSRYAFGLTFWDADPRQCQQRFEKLVAAINHIGSAGKARPKGLGGNFVVDRTQSLVDLQAESPVAIPENWFDLQSHAAASKRTLTLRWLSPLCAELPGEFKNADGMRPGYFDTRRFPAAVLVRRLINRLQDRIGISVDEFADDDEALKIIEPPGLDRLHWIKWHYGTGVQSQGTAAKENRSNAPNADADGQDHPALHDRHPQSHENRRGHRPQQSVEKLFGVMGRITLEVSRPEIVRALVIGQYIHVGEKTNFGLGRYAIEEVQSALPASVPRYLRAFRAVEIADLAFAGPAVEQESNRLNVPLDRVRAEIEEIADGSFHPRPMERFLLPGAKPRLIAVPDGPERVLQRAVYEQLYPVLDLFLSDSCIAYRRGLGRHNAAERIQAAFDQGFRWALRADFHHFFDSIDHALLRDKLEVFIQDDHMVDLLMQWVQSGAPQSGRGLPTGAVISPLLANLFLEQFDSAVERDGGRLVRYADDFVLLFRDPARGREILDRAGELAEQLRLHLNDEKTRLVELRKTPFDFLGYRFFSEKGWQYRGYGLQQVEDMQWYQAPKERDVATQKVLPGEQGLESSLSGAWIVGPHIDWIGIDGPDVVCRSRSRGTEDRFQRRRVGELVVLGPATLDHSLFRNRSEDALQIIVADDIGRWTCALTDAPPLELAGLVQAQVALAADAPRCLQIARRIVAAKLNNHATLALTYPARGHSGELSERLRRAAADALQAADSQELMGIEGAAAAAWYGQFAQRIHAKFKFDRRVHPHATDPVNVMLNIAQTLLHRIICLTLVREGFAPSLGILHQPGTGHAALASDLQEVFRHLMDRVVIEATYVIAPGEFHETSRQPFLRVEPGAYRTLVASAFKMLSTSCIMKTQQAPRSYRQHIATLARSLHRHLLNPEAHFQVFEYIS